MGACSTGILLPGSAYDTPLLPPRVGHKAYKPVECYHEGRGSRRTPPTPQASAFAPLCFFWEGELRRDKGRGARKSYSQRGDEGAIRQASLGYHWCMKWLIGLLVVAVVLGLTAWIWIALAESKRTSNERDAASALKTLATAEADFRANDRDGNHIQDFWAGDVAGLYYLPDRRTGPPMRLIEKAVADADAKPLRKGAPPPVPMAGYLFQAMEGDDSSMTPEVYAQDTKGVGNPGPYYNHSKFGYCAFPADYPRGGRMTFVINEGNTVHKFDTGGKPMLRWPTDPRCPKCGSGHPGRADCGYIQLH